MLWAILLVVVVIILVLLFLIPSDKRTDIYTSCVSVILITLIPLAATFLWTKYTTPSLEKNDLSMDLPSFEEPPQKKKHKKEPELVPNSYFYIINKEFPSKYVSETRVNHQLRLADQPSMFSYLITCRDLRLVIRCPITKDEMRVWSRVDDKILLQNLRNDNELGKRSNSQWLIENGTISDPQKSIKVTIRNKRITLIPYKEEDIISNSWEMVTCDSNKQSFSCRCAI